MYIRPSKYLKALRNEFPKFYPHINIIVQKSTENLPQQKFFHCHKKVWQQFTLTIKNTKRLIKKKHKKKQRKKQNKRGLYNCISAVACNKYSIFDLQKRQGTLNQGTKVRKETTCSQVLKSIVVASERKQFSQEWRGGESKLTHTRTHTLLLEQVMRDTSGRPPFPPSRAQGCRHTV